MTEAGLPPRDRGQSVTINYTLSLIIVTLLISGLFIAMSGYLETQRERVTRSEFDVLGNRLAADIATTDRLARAGDDAQVEVRTAIPAAVAGIDYNVDVESTPFKSSNWHNVTITLRSPRLGVERTLRVRTANEVGDSSLSGGPYEVHYHDSSGELEVHDA
jgi:hypothetical protein